MEEAIEACEGPGGSGEMPMWAVRLMNDPEHDYVVMRKSDFLRFQKEELVFARESKADAKRRKASIPELMRDD
jgi:hypothetical protein